MEYLIILFSLLIVSIFLHWRFRIQLYANRKQAVAIIFVLFFIGVLWDSLAIARGHWLFPSSHHLGIIIGNMPIEEYLFMLIQPYFVLVIYSLIKKFTDNK